ncbi:MAG TPA: prepilin peptidase [Bacillota bacterium]|nr:prepilin peptidase [Bacillota bacterium]
MMMDTLSRIINDINDFKRNVLTLNFFEYYHLGFDFDSVIFLLDWLILLFMIFMIGASFCGFFQCMIYRKSRGINLFITRSFCDVCGKTLQWIDPVPFINYLVLKGKCRYCHTKLPVKYFLSEVLSGVVMLILMFSPLHILFTIPFALFMIFVTAYVIYFNQLNWILIILLALFIAIFKIIYGFGGWDILISLGLILLLAALDLWFKKPEFNGKYFFFLCLFSVIIQPIGVAFGIILARSFSLVLSLGRKISWRREPKEEGRTEDVTIFNNSTSSFTGFYMGFLIFLAFYYS